MDIPTRSAPQIYPAIIDNFPGTRLTTYSPRSFHDVTARLYRAIGFHPSWPSNSSSSDNVTTAAATAAIRPVPVWSGIMERDKRLQQMEKSVEHRRDIFREGVEAVLGPHGFMFFAEIDHGNWIQLFMPSSNDSGAEENKKSAVARQCKRIILGNPLIAMTMLQHDLNAGLAVPVELLLVEQDEEEEEEGEGEKKSGTRILYQLPSALIARVNTNPELREAAEKLDEKLEALVKHVAF